MAGSPAASFDTADSGYLCGVDDDVPQVGLSIPFMVNPAPAGVTVAAFPSARTGVTVVKVPCDADQADRRAEIFRVA